jgi:hypothetical protein
MEPVLPVNGVEKLRERCEDGVEDKKSVKRGENGLEAGRKAGRQ